jgi:hypothetical protein
MDRGFLTISIGNLRPKNQSAAETVIPEGTAFVSGNLMAIMLRPIDSVLMASEHFGTEVVLAVERIWTIRFLAATSPARLHGVTGLFHNFRCPGEVLDVGKLGNLSRGRAVSS